MALTENAKEKIEDAVLYAAENGATEREIKDEFLYAIDIANDEGVLP